MVRRYRRMQESMPAASPRTSPAPDSCPRNAEYQSYRSCLSLSSLERTAARRGLSRARTARSSLTVSAALHSALWKDDEAAAQNAAGPQAAPALDLGDGDDDGDDEDDDGDDDVHLHFVEEDEPDGSDRAFLLTVDEDAEGLRALLDNETAECLQRMFQFSDEVCARLSCCWRQWYAS